MTGKKRNLRSGLKQRRRQGNPMAAFDQLPPPLRAWLAQAALPWSPRSAHRLWCRALQRCEGDVAQAVSHLSQAERRMLAQDRLTQ